MTHFLLLFSSQPARLIVPVIRADYVSTFALLAGVGYSVWSARMFHLDRRSMYWASIWAMFGGLWGAHLLSLSMHGWPGFPLSLFQFVDGGKSLFGGLLAGGIFAGLYFRIRKLPVLSYADAAMPGLALAYAVGRIGCFLNGDDYGTLTKLPWSVTYPPGTEAYADHLWRGWIPSTAGSTLPVHPVQLYLSLVGLVLFVLLAVRRPRLQGSCLCAYLVTYSVARFFLEWLRGDSQPVIGALSLMQIFCILFALMGMALWLRIARTALATLLTEESTNVREPAVPSETRCAANPFPQLTADSTTETHHDVAMAG